MLSIRLTRVGKKSQPLYRLTIAERARDPYGKALEILGSYNPRSKVLQAKQDRIEHWLSKGAKMTVTVNNLLVGNNIIKGEKIRKVKINKKKGQKEK